MKPRFGDWYVNCLASDDNPQKQGMYVETIRRLQGRMNPGIWYRLTDGQGKFWECKPENLTRFDPQDNRVPP